MSGVGWDKSWGQTHFDVLSSSFRHAASLPQTPGVSMQFVICAASVFGNLASNAGECVVVGNSENLIYSIVVINF